MPSDTFRALGFFSLVVVVGGALVLLLPKAFDAAGGTDAQLAAALKATEPDGLLVEVPGFDAPLRSNHHVYARVSFSPRSPTAAEAEVIATLDFTGRLGDIQVSSLGLERLRFHWDGTDWRPTRGWAPLLTSVLAKLEARRKALEAGNFSNLEAMVKREDRIALVDPKLAEVLRVERRKLTVQRWYVRVETGGASVTEEDRLTGDLPERPVDERRTRSLRLVRDGEEFFFSPTVM